MYTVASSYLEMDPNPSRKRTVFNSSLLYLNFLTVELFSKRRELSHFPCHFACCLVDQERSARQHMVCGTFTNKNLSVFGL